jgi:hypothetical protein
MEYYQDIQNRTGQTVAVVNEYLPTLVISGTDAGGLTAASAGLDTLAQSRDDELAHFDLANNAENQGFLALRRLVLGLPQSAAAELDDAVPAESALLDLLAPAFAIVPRTTELALDRAKKIVSALREINPFLQGQVPPRNPITFAGKGLAELQALMAAQPGLEQAVEDRAAAVLSARTALRIAATALDRLNKRFYQKLLSEARENPALAAALAQIVTEGAGAPGTLGIRTILQGGTDGLHLLLSYDNGSYDGTATSTLEWMVVGIDTDFTHTAPADPSGNTIGPFTAGQTVKMRTRVVNSNGTTTGSIRTLTILPPA